ncbi:DUF2268 domain-containing putative Zn-dependent protease [Spongiimicrobium salis]|uniref:DUF2268 domain-containing putative Zn-dependent protease n=1 Tax=Spongiimicrobium salis TaxID=1667022 RepID=UPI00374DBA6F
MNKLKSYTIIALFLGIGCKCKPTTTASGIASITYKEEIDTFTNDQKKLIQEVVLASEKEVRALLPKLPKEIQVEIEIVDWDLDAVGGVTGRTETNSPPFVAIQLSNKFPGGPTTSIGTYLKSTLFHEFHHLYRGWAIKDNTFAQGIDIAAINEGLAVVFSQEYTQIILKADNPPEDAIAEQWAKEILALPKNANYREWMFEHPDGRLAIGYRTGNFMVRKAMANAKKGILEMSQYRPEEILEIAGY